MSLLTNKTIMVTGGGAGIGRATCFAMAREGAKLVVMDRDIELAERTAGEAEALGTLAIAVQGDVTSDDDVSRTVDRALSDFGSLDGAFNNAGIGPREVGAKGALVTEIESEQWNRILEVNLTGVWRCMKAEIRAMTEGGSIVNNASIAGLVGIAGSAAYVASKHGVVGLSKSAALECTVRNIRINAVCPGYVLTDMTPASDELARMIPAGRLGKPTEIAELVTWLCSDRAGYLTGAAINIDGGYIAA